MRVIRFIGILVVSANLASCGGGASSAPSGAAVVQGGAEHEIINGIQVPPDPGPANDATLAGIDSDNNGIRDDMDRWIATKYGDKPEVIEDIRWSARTSQKLVISHAMTKEAALAVIYESMDVGGCIASKLRAVGVSAGQFFDEKLIRTFNTRVRIDARKQLFDLAGLIVRDVAETAIACPYK